MTNSPWTEYFYCKKEGGGDGEGEEEVGAGGGELFHTTLRTVASPGLAITVMDGWCVQDIIICYVCGGRWQAHWVVHLLSSENQEQLCALI